MVADANTRLRVDNSRNSANHGLTVSIEDLSALFSAETDTVFAGIYRFQTDDSKEAANRFQSIRIEDVNTLLNGGEVLGFSLTTRLRLLPGDKSAHNSVSFVEVGALIEIESDSYTASAVHFDGATRLVDASLTTTDNGKATVSVWVYVPAEAEDAGAVFFADPASFVTGSIIYPGVGGLVQDYYMGNAPGADWMSIDADLPIALGIWRHLLISVDTAGTPHMAVYVNDATLGAPTANGAIADAAITFNGLSFNVGYDGSAMFVGDMADLQVYPGVSVLTDGTNTIPEVNRRLFIDASGKPVDPAVAVAELGTPAVLLSGNAAAFVTNQGNGGALTLTGSLTNASTSPSD